MRLISAGIGSVSTTTHTHAAATRPPAAATIARQRVIETILRMNAGATMDFLQRFSDPALRQYLDHLEHADSPRTKNAVWVRRGETAAFNAHEDF